MIKYYKHDGNKIILHDFEAKAYVGVAVLKGEFFTHSEDESEGVNYTLSLNRIIATLEQALKTRGTADDKSFSPTPFFDTDRAIITDDGEKYAVGVKNGKFGAAKRHPQYATSDIDLQDNLDRKLESY